jgi:hypothetical protein
LRDKLKETLEGKANEGKEDIQSGVSSIRPAEALEREIDMLKAQNLALRQALEQQQQQPTSVSKPNPVGFAASFDKVKQQQQQQQQSKGRILGEGEGASPSGPVGSFRQQQHSKWENEKKLQKRSVKSLLIILTATCSAQNVALVRISTLETRLEEKIAENAELEQQLKRAQEKHLSALSAKDEIQRKIATNNKLTQVINKFFAMVCVISIKLVRFPQTSSVTVDCSLLQEARKLTIEDLEAIEKVNV